MDSLDWTGPTGLDLLDWTYWTGPTGLDWTYWTRPTGLDSPDWTGLDLGHIRSEDIDQWSSTWETGKARGAWQAQLGGHYLQTQLGPSQRKSGGVWLVWSIGHKTQQSWHNTKHQTTKRTRRSSDLGRATYDHLVAYAPWTMTWRMI
ncbi:hypothetical protein MMC15_008403 [Xylographa vitiligo]|nr:hypothetical protein [Xylographa vitiligo]